MGQDFHSFWELDELKCYMHVHHGKISELGWVKEEMLVSTGAPSSSRTELYPFSSIKTSCYLMKSSVRYKNVLSLKNPDFHSYKQPLCLCLLSAEACSHMDSVDSLWIWVFPVLLGLKVCWRCRKHFPVLNLKTGREWTIRKLLQSYEFTAPGYYSKIFPHKKLFCHYTVGRQDSLCHLMLLSFRFVVGKDYKITEVRLVIC